MQYVLSEEEFRELKFEKDRRLQMDTEKLQAICTLAAQHIPVPRDWGEDKTPRPWGCIRATPSPGYCDDCPVSEICPSPRKEWSK